MKKNIDELLKLQKKDPLCWQTKESILRLIGIYNSLSKENVLQKLNIDIDAICSKNTKSNQKGNELIQKLISLLAQKWYFKKIENSDFVIYETETTVITLFKIIEKLDGQKLLEELQHFKFNTISITSNDIEIDFLNKSKIPTKQKSEIISVEILAENIKKIENYNLKHIKIICIKDDI